MNICFKNSKDAAKSMNKTPIYVIIDDKICYNYGKNLNELPNYQHLNQFLIFLSPDMNNIFLISFLFLNAYLLMFFFEYNKSLVKQLGRGMIYLCICNFILFSIWLLTMNTANSKELIKVSSLISASLNRLLIWLRYFTMYNETTQQMTAYFRFLLLTKF